MKNTKINKLSKKKCGNDELARFLYQCRKDSSHNYYAKWILFNEFTNVKYLAKSGSGEVHKEKYGLNTITHTIVRNMNKRTLY